jgi:uncharacterized protein (TIGR02246 family)
VFRYRLLVLVLVALVVPALNQQTPNAEAAIARLRTEWAKDLHDKRLDQIVMLYEPKATFLTPNGQRVTGRDAIRDLTKQAMDSFTSDLIFQSITFDSSGAMAYDTGEFRETLTSSRDGSVSHGGGNYLMIFKRQPDGNWLIVQQAWIAAALPPPS